jgi:hypothetical protein
MSAQRGFDMELHNEATEAELKRRGLRSARWGVVKSLMAFPADRWCSSIRKKFEFKGKSPLV